MSRFTPEEIAYLQSQRLGRMATVNEKGDLHVVPVGFRYNPEHETIDIGGHNFASSKKYREAVRHGRIAFVVDDVLPPWKPRFVEVRGTVQAFAEGGETINRQFASDPHLYRFFGDQRRRHHAGLAAEGPLPRSKGRVSTGPGNSQAVP